MRSGLKLLLIALVCSGCALAQGVRPPDGPPQSVPPQSVQPQDALTIKPLTITIGKGELLLSVSVPSRPRYGVRWRQRPPRKKIVLPGTDLPIQVDPSDPQKIEISWESLSSSPWDFAARASAAPPRPVGVQPPPPAAPDPLDELKRLGELRDAGALTEAEFAAEKARVLGRM